MSVTSIFDSVKNRWPISREAQYVICIIYVYYMYIICIIYVKSLNISLSLSLSLSLALALEIRSQCKVSMWKSAQVGSTATGSAQGWGTATGSAQGWGNCHRIRPDRGVLPTGSAQMGGNPPPDPPRPWETLTQAIAQACGFLLKEKRKTLTRSTARRGPADFGTRRLSKLAL